MISPPRLQIDAWRRFIALGCIFGLAAIGFITWMELQLGGTQVTTAVDDIGEAVAAGIAAVSCGWAAGTTHRRLRRAWLLLAA